MTGLWRNWHGDFDDKSQQVLCVGCWMSLELCSAFYCLICPPTVHTVSTDGGVKNILKIHEKVFEFRKMKNYLDEKINLYYSNRQPGTPWRCGGGEQQETHILQLANNSSILTIKITPVTFTLELTYTGANTSLSWVDVKVSKSDINIFFLIMKLQHFVTPNIYKTNWRFCFITSIQQ